MGIEIEYSGCYLCEDDKENWVQQSEVIFVTYASYKPHIISFVTWHSKYISRIPLACDISNDIEFKRVMLVTMKPN